MCGMAERQGLDDRSLHNWLIGLCIGVAVVVGTVWVGHPANAWLVGPLGILAATLFSVTTLDLALGNRPSAAGNVVAATGFALWALAASLEFPGGFFEAGFAAMVAGAAITFAANHGSLLRSIVGR